MHGTPTGRPDYLSVLSVCDVRALWPHGWTDEDETWQAGRPQSWPHCVRWGLDPHEKGQFLGKGRPL